MRSAVVQTGGASHSISFFDSLMVSFFVRAKPKGFTLRCEQNLKILLCGFQFGTAFMKNVISSCGETFILKRRENMTWARYRVKNVEELKRLVNKGVEDYFIALGPKGALRSSKHITYNGRIFHVLNEIDDSEQELTETQLNDPNETNIGEAIKKGAFIAESDNEKIFEED